MGLTTALVELIDKAKEKATLKITFRNELSKMKFQMIWQLPYIE